MITTISGILQIDHERGVIYFHSDLVGMSDGRCPTPLRICGLGKLDKPFSDKQIDITIRPLVVQDHELKEAKVVY
jgi:hypothetical protein